GSRDVARRRGHADQRAQLALRPRGDAPGDLVHPRVDGNSLSCMSAIAIGEQAPDFTLEGTDGPFTLSEHRGEIVALLFYPGDETMVCTKQFCSYRDTGLEGLGATVVGISAQDLASHQKFIDHHGLTVPLPADVDKKAAKAY